MSDTRPAVTIPAGAWEPVGDADDPNARLLSALTINGLAMHLEAWAVRTNEDGEREADFDSEIYQNVTVGLGEEEERWDTITLHGREYVLIAYPMS